MAGRSAHCAPRQTREAKKVCLTCEVRTDCLESALMKDERFGIWGGLSERERRKLKKKAV